MHFDYHKAIWFFWLVPVVIIVFIIFENRSRSALFAVYSKNLISQRLPHYSPVSSVVRFVLFVLALSFLGAAWLKPYTSAEMHEVKRKGVDLYFVVDLSQSMLAQDIKPSRIGRAQREISDFLSILKGDRVGLIGFAGTSYVFVPLTTDYSAFDLFTDELTPDSIPTQGTDIKGALTKAVDSFKRQSQSSAKAIVLISDGEDSQGLDAAMISDIQKMGIKVFVVGIGTPEGSPIPLPNGGYKADKDGQVVLSKLNETALQNLAVTTGGGYVRSVTGDMDLDQIYFEGIKKSFQSEDISSHQKKIPHYIFQWFILMGLLLFMAEILITNKKYFWRGLLFRRRINGLGVWVVLWFVLLMFSTPVFAFSPFALDKANKDYQAQQYDASLQRYRDLLKSDPDSPELNYNAGNAYYRLQKYKEAEQAFQKSLNATDPQTRKHSLYNLGNTKFRENDLQAAIDYYDKALEMDPNYKEAELNRGFAKKVMEEKKKEQQQQKDPSDQSDQTHRSDQQQNQQNQQDQQDQQQKDPSDSSDQTDQADKSDQQQSQPDNADKWLSAVPDNPGQVLQKMINQQAKQQKKKVEKDW